MGRMTPDTAALVRQSWQFLSERPEQFTETFYRRLFQLDPGIRAMFASTDLVAQGKKLMAMMGLLVEALEQPTALVAGAAALGQRHAGYGVVPRHYDLAGEALLATIEEVQGAGCTAEVREAWLEVFTLFASVMQRGASRSSGKYQVVEENSPSAS
jgi:hemoglobin-like flavoprotein